jgi:hypothetical protein
MYIKEGKKAYRRGWNGTGLLVKQVENPCNILDNEQLANDMEMKYFMVIEDNYRKSVNIWVPSISDLYAYDWCILDER